MTLTSPFQYSAQHVKCLRRGVTQLQIYFFHLLNFSHRLALLPFSPLRFFGLYVAFCVVNVALHPHIWVYIEDCPRSVLHHQTQKYHTDFAPWQHCRECRYWLRCTAFEADFSLVCKVSTPKSAPVGLDI